MNVGRRQSMPPFLFNRPASLIPLPPHMRRTKAGSMLDDLAVAELRLGTLFEGDTEKRTRLMGALDDINERFRPFTAVPAAQGFESEWKMRAESRSPAWTTRLDEVPVVRAK